MTITPELEPHVLVERNGSFGVNEVGDIVVPEDFEDGHLFPDTASRIQGRENFLGFHAYQKRIKRDTDLELDIEDHDREESRKERERLVSMAAMENAGVFVTLEEHRDNMAEIAGLATRIGRYKGLRNGGSQSKKFVGKYTPYDGNVAAAAEQAYKNIVHHQLPKIYKADELIQAGFNKDDVMDDATTGMHVKIKRELTGPENAKTRAEMKKKYS